MKNLISWFVTSSKNPEAWSLSLKSFFPLILALAPAIGLVDLSSGDLDQVTTQLLAVVSGVSFLYGFVRKVYLTLKK